MEDNEDWLVADLKKSKPLMAYNTDQVVRFALYWVYMELRARSGDCEHCEDVNNLYRELKKIFDDAGIKPESLSNS